MECFLKEITLENFRNFKQKSISFSSNQILIIGQNGAGKTSILEAISLLTASKGLRGEKLSHLINSNEIHYRISYDLESYLGNVFITQDLKRENSKRVIEMNEKKISNSELSNFLNIFWLIPQQNTLFQNSAQDRRKLFDRIVYSFYPDHAASLHKYEHYQRERLKILSMDRYDVTWVDIIEEKLVSLAIDISRKRLEIVDKINNIISAFDTDFPKISVGLIGDLEELFVKSNSLETDLKDRYNSTRRLDAESHKTHFGALKTDMNIIHKGKNQNAFLCSTGEQQACLVSLILGHTELFKELRKKRPIILLDELFSHLDLKRREELSEYLINESIQTFVTTTEKEFCKTFATNSQVIEI